MSNILALDLGTNSIGWALVEHNGAAGRIVGLGSRILPTSRELVRSFEAGMPLLTPAARRRELRAARRKNEHRRSRRRMLAQGITPPPRPTRSSAAPACPYERRDFPGGSSEIPCIPLSHPLCQQLLGFRDTHHLLSVRHPAGRISPDEELRLWHLLYSVTDPDERRKALARWGAGFAEAFATTRFEREYGPCSAVAAKKLLPLIEQGMRWEQAVEQLYGKRQKSLHDLRNPIVRDVVAETMRLVADIEARWGKPHAIHLELGSAIGNGRHARRRAAAGDPLAPHRAEDTRTITRAVADLLEGAVGHSNVVRCSEASVARLRRDWGLEQVWDELIAPRFERLGALRDSDEYGRRIDGHFHPSLPEQLRKGFRKKRLDHRNHALDALVVACVTEGIWEGFVEDARTALEGVVVSHKRDTRVLGKSHGRLSIRKPLHKQSFWGRVDEKTAAMRKPLDTTFTARKIARVCQPFLRRLLLEWLERHAGDPREAFGAAGIAGLNAQLAAQGRPPIYRVRITEELGQKFPVGTRGVKAQQWVSAEQGTNLYFGIYHSPDGRRTYRTIPLREVIERLKQRLPPVPEQLDGNPLLMSLSPGELVYVPASDAEAGFDPTRIYKVVSCSERECHFVPHTFAWPIVPGELGSAGRCITSWDGQRIKAVCRKLDVDRLGLVDKGHSRE